MGYNQGDTITFTGTGEDAEDGTPTGSSLVWTSSIDGQIGTGGSFTRNGLSAGTHTITLTVTDSDGATGSDLVSITVNTPGNTPPQLSSGYVSPESGTTLNTFTFYVDYYDADGDSPATRYVYIDGTGYAMEFHSGTFSNGTYHYDAALAAGTHTFYFEFTDGNGGTSRLPTTGTYSGPEVETTVVEVTGKILNNGLPFNRYWPIMSLISKAKNTESGFVMKLLDQVGYVIRKRIISYSTENATQKICKVQGIPCLNKIEGLSDSHCPYAPPVCLWQNNPHSLHSLISPANYRPGSMRL